jgi:hypothetical protein
MVCNKAVATTYIKHVSARREYACDFERHVVCSSNFSSSAHPREAAFDGCG